MNSACKIIKYFAQSVLLMLAAHATAEVPLWGIFQTSVQNTKSYKDVFRDVDLDVVYTSPSGKKHAFFGFYDGGSTWKFRFMPDEIGTWQYSASFSDGSLVKSGSFKSVPSNIPGMLSLDESNPNWFGYKGGNHVFVRSFHVGDRFFAENWPASDRQAFLDWAQDQGYNMLSIASFFLNRNVDGRGKDWQTPSLWPLDPSEYAKAEIIMDELSARKILIFPFAGFIGQHSASPVSDADRKLYFKYTIARFAPYWNIAWNVAGPEPLAFPEKFDNKMDEKEVEKLGRLIESLDPFGHLVSVHNGDGYGDDFIDNDWLNYSILQGAKGFEFDEIYAYMRKNHKKYSALYAQESFWPGNEYGHIGADDLNLIRKKAYVFAMAAAAVNFADMNGNSSSGFSGNLDINSEEMHPAMHPVVNQVWDFFESIPYYLMNPLQEITDRGYALAKPGSLYLVYLPEGGIVNLDIAPGTYHLTWIDAQDPNNRRVDGGKIKSGKKLSAPKDGDDWLLYLVEKDFSYTTINQ